MGNSVLEQDIIITGAAGFIGSCLAKDLLRHGVRPEQMLLVDSTEAYLERKCSSKLRSLNLRFVESEKLLEDLKTAPKVSVIFHMGASSSTEEMREDFLKRVNIDYSKTLWEYCTKKQTPFYYASSAATYGNGAQGFDDAPENIPTLKPLNPYGKSKWLFDLYVLDAVAQNKTPPSWAGFKFFNVYGHGEEHKEKQASVLWGARRQLRENGVIRLFKSHHPDYADGEQMRDFVWIGDITRTLEAFWKGNYKNGIYNLGTGEARSFLDLAKAICAAEKHDFQVEFVATPEHLQEHYQYYTQATLERLRASGYDFKATSLEEGVKRSIEDIDSGI